MEPQSADPHVGIPAAPSLGAPAGMPGLHPQGAAGTASTGVPQGAEDNEIIEQEWVAAVKRTLEQYKDDPYLLSRAMTALRQDYLQKRYGRTVEAANQ